MQQQSISVFRSHYLSTSTPPAMAATAESDAIPVNGNQVVMSIQVINGTDNGAPVTCNFQLRGSIDGQAWINIGSATEQHTFGYAQDLTTGADFAYPFVSVAVEYASTVTTDSVLFDVTLGFSDQ